MVHGYQRKSSVSFHGGGGVAGGLENGRLVALPHTAEGLRPFLNGYR